MFDIEVISWVRVDFPFMMPCGRSDFLGVSLVMMMLKMHCSIIFNKIQEEGNGSVVGGVGFRPFLLNGNVGFFRPLISPRFQGFRLGGQRGGGSESWVTWVNTLWK